jgi:hypothetical protein
MGIANERIIPTMADHRSMCRFSDPASQRYQPVEQAILDMVAIARGGRMTSNASLSKICIFIYMLVWC